MVCEVLRLKEAGQVAQGGSYVKPFEHTVGLLQVSFFFPWERDKMDYLEQHFLSQLLTLGHKLGAGLEARVQLFLGSAKIGMGTSVGGSEEWTRRPQSEAEDNWRGCVYSGTRVQNWSLAVGYHGDRHDV
jgi:hypothetical protein